MALTNIESAEKAIEIERTQYADLVTLDDGTPALWEDLVRRSAPALPHDRRPYFPRWSAYSAFTPSALPSYYDLPPELAAEWAEYRERWERFMNANPRVRIAEMMSEISEAYDACSFPNGYERAIEKWVRSGFKTDAPVPYLGGIDTPEWRARFVEAVKAAGEGWVYYDEVYNWR